MDNIYLNQMSQEDMEYDGFYDGEQLIIPDGTELEFVVVDGFVGIEEGKSQQVCMINISITTPGEYFGQKYRYNAKIYDMDASKRDRAMKNLGVLDAQAGFPMTNGRLPLTTENVQQHWSGNSEARVKFGLLVSEEDGREVNFVRGFGYLREKMVQPGGKKTQQAQQQTAPQAQQKPADMDDDIDF